MIASYGGQLNCRHLERRDTSRSTMSCWRAKTPLPSYVCRTRRACLLLVVWLVDIAFRPLAVDIANALGGADHPLSVGECSHHWSAFAAAKPAFFAETGNLPSRSRCRVKVKLIRHLRARAPPSYAGMWLRRLCRCSLSTPDCGTK